MPLTYATITGTIHFPGSTAGVRCLVTAVPGVESAGISGPDGLLYGVASKPTDSTGALPTGSGALQIPLVDTDTLVWSFFAEPLNPERGGPGNVGLQRWNFYNGPITASTTLQALADTINTLIPADFPEALLPQVVAARDAALAAQAGAEAVGTTNDTIIAGRINTPDSATAAALAPLSVKTFGAVGDGTTNDTAAITATLAAAKAARSFTIRRTVVYFPNGVYLCDPIAVPAGVSLLGQSRSGATLVNRSTAGTNVFVRFAGSFSECRDLRLDGRRIAQAVEGLATVQFSRSNNPTAGGTNIAGGVVLSGPVSSGATSITLTNANPAGTPIEAGEYVTLVESTKFEMVQVAASYTSGTTVALVNPTSQSFTTAAKVSVAVTGVGIFDCDVLGNGRDGIAFWHTIVGKAHRNRVSDFEDTGIDVPSAGSWWVDVADNTIETQGRWGVYFDTAETEFGPVTECTSRNNVIRFQSGGSFVNGNTVSGIGFGNVVRCKSINDTVDLTLAGLAGLSYDGDHDYAKDSSVESITVLGPVPIRTNTFGVRVTANNTDCRPKVIGGVISHVQRGVEFNTVRSGIVNGTQIIDVSDFAVNVTADSANVQRIVAVGVVAVGNVAGFRVGGAGPVAGSKASVTGCSFTDSSFAPVLGDTNWTVTQTGNLV